MAIPTDIAALQQAVYANYEKLILELYSIPSVFTDSKELEGHAKDTMMSVNNLLSYLIGWGELVLKWNRKKESDEAVDFPETGFKWNQLGGLAQKFYKDYEDLFKTQPSASGIRIANNNGYGYARGVEFFWRDKATIKNFDYWISYSYLDTKRDYLNFPTSIEPSFAAKHTASLVMKKFVLKWKTGFNASYNFSTGRPYYNIVYSSATNAYELKDLGRTISYNNLGFGMNYLPKLGDPKSKKFAVWVLSISNVLGSRQVYGYNYATLSSRKEAILPPSRRFVYVGYFLSIGTDRTDDAINNNL